MKLSGSRKMWLLMVVGACLVLVQYHLANSWLLNSQPLTPQLPSNMQAALDQLQLQLDDSVVAAVGERVLHDIAVQVSQKLSSELCINLMDDTLLSVAARRPPVPSSSVPPLFIITPTYRRPEQIPELTRLAQTLMHIPNIHWLVIEDSVNKTSLVTQLLFRTGIPFEHLVDNFFTTDPCILHRDRGEHLVIGPKDNSPVLYPLTAPNRILFMKDEPIWHMAPMPESYKNRKGSKPRGVSNRNRGLQWLRANATKGVFYFADDDNTYDIALFDEMRYTKRVSMWPVGLCTKYGLSSPIVRNGSFAGFYDGWIAGRKFPVDMAGFAVSVKFLLQRPKATMPYKPGFEEDGFLRSLAPFEAKEIELKADNCTKILVWHTQTKKNEPASLLDMSKHNNTNLVHLRSLIV